jgi:ABC-type Na+ efflux pump permease subunit
MSSLGPRAVLSVAVKELRASLRDRQTVLYTVVLPLALYPVLFWIMLQGMFLLQGHDEATPVRVALVGSAEEVDRARLTAALRAAPEAAAEPGPVEVDAPDLSADDAARLFGYADRGATNFDVDAVLILDTGGGAQLLYDSTRSRSELAAARVRERLDALAAELTTEAVAARGTSLERLAPFAVTWHDVASRRELGGFVLSLILPVTFVIMAFFGSFFPAVDLTAGEKERGTAETTLLAPLPRSVVHLGKVLAVTVMAGIATTLNFAGLSLAAESLLSQLAGGGLAFEVPWSAFVRAAPIAVLFLFFSSSLLLALANRSATFKQGQALLGSAQLVFLGPALIATLPGLELTAGLALVPVMQTVLALRAVFEAAGTDGALPWFELALVVASQLGYALLALWISLRSSSSEALFFGGARRGLLSRFGGTPTR